MDFMSVADVAKKWNISERSVRNYCAQGRIEGAVLTGKTWLIPKNAKKPLKLNSKKVNNLLTVLKEQKQAKLKGGIYHKTQVELAYNSNHIEGSTLTKDQTQYIFETNTIGVDKSAINVDDIIETTNHFKCFDFIIENANKTLSQGLIKKIHYILKNGTSDCLKSWFNVGDYKKLPNEVGGMSTCKPSDVSKKMQQLIETYNAKKQKTLNDIIEFHYNFENIHPFQDGNGRVGRIIMFKECLANNIVPFIIDDNNKMFYYRGLKEFKNERGFLIETCLAMQDKYKAYLDYFQIEY